jgi:hypothetical protein
MPSGGKREGTPGTKYPNRTDMAQPQAPQAPKGQTYGQAGQQMAAQNVVPIAGAPSAPTGPPSTGGPPGNPQLPGMEPGMVPGLADPSAMPMQPVTAGLPSGPGPGLEGLSTASYGPEDLSHLRGIYLQHPSEDLRRIIEHTEQNLA